MDFVHDQLATGKKIRVLTVVDTSSRFSPVIDPRFSYRAEDVVGKLDRVCASTGYPKTIRVDQGSELVSRDMDLWPMPEASRSTSRDPASQQTTRSSKRSTGGSGRNA
jgi:transposase InsO family protein